MINIKSIEDYPSGPGIYKFTNKTNGKVYIGETRDFRVRMQKYKCSHNRGKVIHLITRAMLKYGIDGFHYQVLERFPEGTPKHVLLDREEFWIRIYDATNKKIGYNISKRGRERKGFIMSDEARKKISLAGIGRKHSPDTCRRMGISRSGDNHWTRNLGDKTHPLIGTNISEERKKKLRDERSGIPRKIMYKKVNQIDPISGEIINTFDSIGHAAEVLNGNRKKYHGISHVLAGNDKTAYGFKWEYAK